MTSKNYDRLMKPILFRMIAEQITAFTDDEITRVFSNCVAESKLVEAAHALIADGKLTMQMVKADPEANRTIVTMARLDGTVRPCSDCNGVWVSIDGQYDRPDFSEGYYHRRFVYHDGQMYVLLGPQLTFVKNNEPKRGATS